MLFVLVQVRDFFNIVEFAIYAHPYEPFTRETLEKLCIFSLAAADQGREEDHLASGPVLEHGLGHLLD